MHCVELQRLAGARMKAAACWIAINEVAAFTAFNSRRRTDTRTARSFAADGRLSEGHKTERTGRGPITEPAAGNLDGKQPPSTAVCAAIRPAWPLLFMTERRFGNEHLSWSVTQGLALMVAARWMPRRYCWVKSANMRLVFELFGTYK